MGKNKNHYKGRETNSNLKRGKRFYLSELTKNKEESGTYLAVIALNIIANYVENTQPEGWGVDLTVKRLLNLQAHLRKGQTQTLICNPAPEVRMAETGQSLGLAGWLV